MIFLIKNYYKQINVVQYHKKRDRFNHVIYILHQNF